MPAKAEWLVAFVLPLHLTLLAWYMLSSSKTDHHQDTSSYYYFKLWCFYFLLDASYGYLFHTLLLVPARWIARQLPGAVMPPPNDEKKLVEQEESSDDVTLEWPSAIAIANLPPDWVIESKSHKKGNENKSNVTCNKSKSKKKIRSKNANIKSSSQQTDATTNQNNNSYQPYYLNHVRGSTRIRQASQRIGAALGTLLTTYLICCCLSTPITLEDLGLTTNNWGQDLARGFLVGSSIVVIIFVIEVQLGWIEIIGFFQTADPNESFTINFIWDILFHIGVSINEEVMLRGWMFTLGCRGIHAMALNLDWFQSSSSTATFSIIASIILQSSLFAFLHLHSPGSTYVSLINLFVGGIAASINVMVSGGSIWLGVGWHFGWNICMGHILGRSTSGIPLSCACIDLVPQPSKCFEKFHGGTFGPEQGVLAPMAYILGILMVTYIYGYEGMISWKDR